MTKTTTENLANLVNRSPKTLKKMIHSFIDSGNMKALTQLIQMGVNIFYFDTFFKLLLRPLFLITIPYIYLWSKPINYARVIPTEFLNPSFKNCGFKFSNNTESILSIAEISPKNLQMSDFNQLDDIYYFAALIMLISRLGDAEKNIDYCAKLIDSIRNKPETSVLVDHFSDSLGISLETEDSLGNKVKNLVINCPSETKTSFLLFSLMMSYSPHIPSEIISIITHQIGTISEFTNFSNTYYSSYNIPQNHTDQPQQIIPRLICYVREMNAHYTAIRHHLVAIFNMFEKGIKDPDFTETTYPVIAMILLANTRAFASLKEVIHHKLKNSEEPYPDVTPTEITPHEIIKFIPKAQKAYDEDFDNQRKSPS